MKHFKAIGVLTIFVMTLVGCGSNETPHIHSPGEEVRENDVPATCLGGGSYDLVTYCSECHEELSRETKTISPLGHDIHHVDAKAATCTEDGYEEYDYCSRCDYSTKVVIHATGHLHTATRHDNAVEAECETSGSYDLVTYCSDCGYVISSEHVTTDPLGHDIHHVPGKAATCTEDGYEEYDYCSRCDYSTEVVIHATGHLHTATRHDNVVEAGCETSGSYDLVTYCSDCGYAISSEHVTTDPLGHEYQKVSSTPATLDHDGFDTYECTRCHDTYDEKTEDKITDPIKYEEYSYYDSSSGKTIYGYKVVGYYGEPEELIVPSKHNDKDVLLLESSAFQFCTSVKKIDVANNVTIGNWAFKGCSNLEELCLQYATANMTYATYYTNASIYSKTQFGTLFGEEKYDNSYQVTQHWNWADTYYTYIPNNLKKLTIRTGALTSACSGLTSLEEVTVRVVGQGAFYNCTNLKTVRLLNGSCLYPSAFSNCNNLKTIYCEGTVGRYNSSTTDVLSTVDEVILEDSVTSISSYAFYGFPMKSIRMSPNIIAINDYAFYNNTNLLEIEIPKAVSSIGGYNFYNCKALRKVTYKATNATFTFDASRYPDKCPFKNSDGVEEVFICKGVEAIEWFMFSSATPFVMVNLSGYENFASKYISTFYITDESKFAYEEIDECSVYTINDKKYLSSYNGDSDTFIVPDYVDDFTPYFVKNENIKNLTINNNIKTLGQHALENSKIESLYLDAETIESYSMSYCSNLTSLTLGIHVTSIKNDALFGCYGFDTVYYEGTKEQWGLIEKEPSWKTYTVTKVQCSDGVITL